MNLSHEDKRLCTTSLLRSFNDGLLFKNSIIVKMGKDKVKLAPTVGIKTFQSPISKKFQMIDKNIFGPGYNVPGSITADQLGNVLMSNRNLTPQLLDDLRGLVGKKQFDRFVRGKIQQGFDKSLIYAKEGDTMGLTFDPFKFEDMLFKYSKNKIGNYCNS